MIYIYMEDQDRLLVRFRGCTLDSQIILLVATNKSIWKVGCRMKLDVSLCYFVVRFPGSLDLH